MDPPIVYIEKEPFLNMVWSAIETFNRECLGFVFGKKPSKSRNYFTVENVVNIQLAKVRKNLKVHQSQAGSDRVDKVVNKYPKLFPFIGDFHSHPEWRQHKRLALPSDQDKESMLKDQIDLSIIIKISSINKDRPIWETVPEGGVNGSLDRYKFYINAFGLMVGSSREKEIKMLEIHAPVAIKSLNTALGYR